MLPLVAQIVEWYWAINYALSYSDLTFVHLLFFPGFRTICPRCSPLVHLWFVSFFCHFSHYGIGNQRFIKINHLCLKVPNYLSHWAINDQHVPNDLAETQIQISKSHFTF